MTRLTAKLTVTLIATVATIGLSGCAFVDKTDGGKKVRVLTSAEVTTCRKIGNTRTSVTASVAGIERPAETVANELETVGRNSAAEMGGDTIVAATPIEDGKQSFHVYKCVDPNAE
ncbi:MAG: DUF4156 domain-containing protein [Pseudomonadota bacterium]